MKLRCITLNLASGSLGGLFDSMYLKAQYVIFFLFKYPKPLEQCYIYIYIYILLTCVLYLKCFEECLNTEK